MRYAAALPSTPCPEKLPEADETSKDYEDDQEDAQETGVPRKRGCPGNGGALETLESVAKLEEMSGPASTAVSARASSEAAGLDKTADVLDVEMLKQAKKLSKVKRYNPLTWKHLKEAGEAEKFTVSHGARMTHKAIKHGAKA